MGKQVWKPGNMVYPVPAVLVSAADGEGRTNLITVAWTGTICTNPPMAYISVRPERYSYPEHRAVCDQSDHRGHDVCHGSVRREVRPRSG